MSSVLSPSNVDSTAVNVVQARLPKLSPKFIAQHYPASVKLLHVHLIHRHGERTPSAYAFPNISPKYWNFCTESNRLNSDFAKVAQHHAPGVYKDVNKGRKWYSYVFKTNQAAEHSNGNAQFTAATCALGQLTDVGRQSMTALGAHMRALYVDALGFLPAVPRSGNGNGPTEDLYLRSTSYSRTRESLQQALGGMYPNMPASSPLFYINMRPAISENLYPDFQHKELEQLHIESAVKSIELFGKEYAALHKRVAQTPGLGGEVEPEPKPAVPRASYFIWDTMSSMLAHGLALPKDVDDEFVSQVSRMSAVEYMYPVKLSAKLARVQMEPFVGELVDTIANAVEADSGTLSRKPVPPKMSIYSGHDTTIGPLLSILGDALDGSPLLPKSTGPMWPPFASSLRIELLKDSTSPHPTVLSTRADQSDKSTILPEERTNLPNSASSLYHQKPKGRANSLSKPVNLRDYYVRIWYNDRSVQLPACLNPGTYHAKLGSTVCTLDAFFEQIAHVVPGDNAISQDSRVSASTLKN
ncbi:hypothetical protein GGI20_003446 [Coemansia sp. BCRC 34301]|nr:hypothetical protein GGI20_003446 [Coemansia sp. BCRC 34301]